MNQRSRSPWGETAPPMYPLFLKLENRRCVVVGGGPIGAMKARDLLRCGAWVEVVSPTLSAEWDRLGVEWYGQLHHEARTFVAADVDSATLVFSATGDPESDDVVYEAATRRNVLVNVVDVPHRCDFYAASVVRRGPVTVAIGTTGASPSVSVVLRERLEAWVTEPVGELAACLGDRRAELLARFPAYASRADRLHAGVRTWFDALSAGTIEAGPEAFDAWIDQVLACDRPCAGSCACAAEAIARSAMGVEA